MEQYLELERKEAHYKIDLPQELKEGTQSKQAVPSSRCDDVHATCDNIESDFLNHGVLPSVRLLFAHR